MSHSIEGKEEERVPAMQRTIWGIMEVAQLPIAK